MQKEFDIWNEKKKELHASPELNYKAREIWICSMGINIGTEADGKGINFARPVLIYKEISREMFWGIPLTTKPHEGKSYFTFNLGGLDNTANFTQMRPMSTRRLDRKVTVMPEAIFLEVKRRLFDTLS